ncbi:glycosyltransferase family 2 protein [cf. Phormidesmis sp. LEGE 11477]|uniref:glycosyltransferase family 2 protein n=1 Tax=cf. Phormidesmis sp. LEGE 11477 TaxID=1828680 RepID=UPI0018816ACD|nr:glycosyltransferase family A protein [cf. Phormidesmis sp. LEGE 11477]MBE9061362.1 hypothetical protein [cf. Phormidesmis sp. LEGE 11477]
MPNFAALIFVGPGNIEACRLSRLCESLLIHEPTVQTLVIIDDSSEHNFKEILPAELQERTTILPNPRNKRGDWWQGGLCVGLAEGLRWLGENRQVEFVVRLDTDALVINRFSDRVMAALNANSETGLLGTWDKYPLKGNQRLPHEGMSKTLPPMFKKSMKYFAIWRHSDWPTRIQCVLNRNDRIVRNVISRAIRNGYRPGDFIQGGAYAIRGQLVQDLYIHHLTTTPLAFLSQLYGEDILVTLFCYAVGYYPEGCNQSGDVFAVQSKGIPAPIDELKNNSYSIIHSIKGIEAFSSKFKSMTVPSDVL